MWPRVVEIMLACWLAMSPLVFRTGAAPVWTVDLAGAAAIVVLASLSFARSLRRAHLAIGVVALLLAGHAFLQPRPLDPPSQNHLVTGLLLAMFAIIPSRASTPPPGWR